MHPIRFTLSLIVGTVLFSLPTPGTVVAQEQEAGHCPGRLEALDLAYRQELRESSAAGSPTSPRWPTSRAVGRRTTRTGGYSTWRSRETCAWTHSRQPKAAWRRSPWERQSRRPGPASASIPWAQDLRALATSVQVFARAEKGEYDQSLADLKALFKRPGCGPQAAAKSDAATAFAVGEAYFQRLIRSGRYDVARKLCELACKDDALAALKGHFEARMARLDLLDKPAPVISGTDVDGRQVSLADLKGKVVLVNFRESWCSHCAGSSTTFECLGPEVLPPGLRDLGCQPRCDAIGRQGWHNGAGDRSPVHGQTRRDLDLSARLPEDGERHHGLWRGGVPGELPH